MTTVYVVTAEEDDPEEAYPEIKGIFTSHQAALDAFPELEWKSLEDEDAPDVVSYVNVTVPFTYNDDTIFIEYNYYITEHTLDTREPTS